MDQKNPLHHIYSIVIWIWLNMYLWVCMIWGQSRSSWAATDAPDSFQVGDSLCGCRAGKKPCCGMRDGAGGGEISHRAPGKIPQTSPKKRNGPGVCGWDLRFLFFLEGSKWFGVVHPKQPPGMYKNERKEWEELPTSTGDRWISEPSTVAILCQTLLNLTKRLRRSDRYQTLRITKLAKF